MTTALFAPGKAALLRGEFGLESGDIRAILVNELYTADFTAHASLEDVDPAARAATAVALSAKVITVTDGLATFDADDVTFAGVPAGDDVIGVILYLETGDETTSTLIGFFDYFANLVLTPDGRDMVFSWPSTVDRIFTW